ncbi:hypothetical protein [Novosphingobium lentum]|uniref:hypothetical protein n=1 Tax=Novosphingobium lentum TaxID=145287 RepID=UPI000ACCAB0D|nr:hypothetical protein [Novosphingobium lentum]
MRAPIHYAFLWLKRSFHRSFGIGDAIAGGIGSAANIGLHFHPSWQSKMTEMAWQIPLFGLAAALLWRLLIAPYELWKEQKDRADKAECGLVLEAKKASLTIEIDRDGGAKEIASVNVNSWRGEALVARSIDEDGKVIAHDMLGQWFFAVWFDRPVFDYEATLRVVGNDLLALSVSWQIPRGVFFTVSIPEKSAAVQLAIESRPNAG